MKNEIDIEFEEILNSLGYSEIKLELIIDEYDKNLEVIHSVVCDNKQKFYFDEITPSINNFWVEVKNFLGFNKLIKNPDYRKSDNKYLINRDLNLYAFYPKISYHTPESLFKLCREELLNKSIK